MLHVETITSSEFEKRCKQGDVTCILAQALAEEALGIGYNLAHKKEFIRQRYMDLATDLINKLKKHNLNIIHENLNGDKNGS